MNHFSLHSQPRARLREGRGGASSPNHSATSMMHRQCPLGPSGAGGRTQDPDTWSPSSGTARGQRKIPLPGGFPWESPWPRPLKGCRRDHLRGTSAVGAEGGLPQHRPNSHLQGGRQGPEWGQGELHSNLQPIWEGREKERALQQRRPREVRAGRLGWPW